MANGKYRADGTRRPSSKARNRLNGARWRRLRQKVFSTYGRVCVYCRQPFPEQELSIEHLISASQGGTNRIDNLRPACQPCNNNADNPGTSAWVLKQNVLKAMLDL